MKKRLFHFLILMLSIFVITACGNSKTSAPNEEKEKENTENTANENVDFPTETITLIVPYDAGGGTDLGFRVLAHNLEAELGVPVVVVNKPGGNGWLGWEELQKAKPDGYTIAAINGLVSGYMNPSAERSETLEDFTIIANHVYDPGVIAMKPGEDRFTSIEELIEFTKKNEVLAGFSTVGSDEHFSMLTLNKTLGTKFIPVQLGGGAKVLSNLMGGHIDVGFANVGEVAQPAEAGQLDVLVVFSDERVSNDLPDVPTMEEATGEAFVNGSSRGLGGPKGMDPKVVEIINTAIEKAMQSSDHLEKMADMGLIPKFINAANYKEMLKGEEATINEYIEELGWGK
jgi:tripartite-type tricarboxylate transporter receptor subunit TctC